MTVRFGLALLLSMASIGLAWADPPASNPPSFWQHFWSTSACPSVGCCPNDYVRKPMPTVCPLPCGGSVDDYCRKPMPCISLLPCCGTPDDYCRKTPPCLLCPPPNPFLQCGPSDNCGKR